MPCSKKKLTVVAGLLIQENKILLSQRRENDSFGLLWEFPGGTVEEGETKKQALVRELKEELGINAVVGDLVAVFSDEREDLAIEVFLFKIQSYTGRLSSVECKDFGFFLFEQAGKLNLAPVDRKIYNYISPFLHQE